MLMLSAVVVWYFQAILHGNGSGEGLAITGDQQVGVVIELFFLTVDLFILGLDEIHQSSSPRSVGKP